MEISPEAMKLLAGYSWPGNVRELENAIERADTLSETELISAKELPENVKEGALASREEERLTFKAKTDEYEKGLILEKLRSTGWNISEAAKQLKLTRQDLQYKIKKYGLKKST